MQASPSSTSTSGANSTTTSTEQGSSSTEASLKRKRGSSSSTDGEVQKVVTRVKRINLGGDREENLKLWDELNGLKWKGEGWKSIKGLEDF